MHHTTLSTFATVVDVLEGGSIYDQRAHKTALRIIKICQQEEQRQLKRYDAAIAKTNGSKS